MTRHPYLQRSNAARDRHTAIASLGGGLLFVLAAMGLLVAISYPVYTLALAGGVATTAALFRLGAPRLARELHGRMAEVDVPGIGTVRIQVDGR